MGLIKFREWSLAANILLLDLSCQLEMRQNAAFDKPASRYLGAVGLGENLRKIRGSCLKEELCSLSAVLWAKYEYVAHRLSVLSAGTARDESRNTYGGEPCIEPDDLCP